MLIVSYLENDCSFSQLLRQVITNVFVGNKKDSDGTCIFLLALDHRESGAYSSCNGAKGWVDVR